MKRLMALVASLGLAAVGCGELVAPAAATVSDEKITIDEVDGVLEDCTSGAAFEEAARQSSGPELRKRIERGYLNRSIRLAIFESKAERLGVEVTDAEVDEQLEQIRGQFPNEEDLAARALQEAICIGGPLRDLITLSLLEERLRTQVTEGLGPNEEELRTFYEENLRQFTQGIHTAHILVEDKAEANKIARRLKKASAGEVDGLFGRLANKFSIDTQSAKKGGDLGTVPLGQFVPEFENTALSLEEGEIADPVQSQFGFHIIRLIEKDVVSFDDARPQILQQFPGDEAQEAWRDWVLDAYRDADVDVNPRYGEFDLETQTIRAPGPEDIPGGATPTTSPAPTPTGTPAP
jgi:parvulin-like peptidyl-prolyl isomerase